MSLSVLCPGCQQRLTGPDTLAGKRLACPKCKTPVVMPAAAGGSAIAPGAPAAAKNVAATKPIATPQPVARTAEIVDVAKTAELADLAHTAELADAPNTAAVVEKLPELSDILDDAMNSAPTNPFATNATPKNTFFTKRQRWRSQPESYAAAPACAATSVAPNWFGDHKLVTATFVMSFVVAGLFFTRYWMAPIVAVPMAVFLLAYGILHALGRWVVQENGEESVWKTVETLLGNTLILLSALWELLMVLIFVAGLFMPSSMVYKLSQMDAGHGIPFLALNVFWLIVLIVSTYCYYHLYDQFGYFKVTCWAFCLSPLLSVGLVMIVAFTGVTVQVWGVVSTNALENLNPVDIGEDPNSAIANDPAKDKNKGKATSGPERLARTMAPWQADVDPGQAPAPLSGSPPPLPAPAGAEVVFSSGALPVVAIGNNVDTSSDRQIFDLRTSAVMGHVAGRIAFQDRPLVNGSLVVGTNANAKIIEAWSFAGEQKRVQLDVDTVRRLTLRFLDEQRLVACNYSENAGHPARVSIWNAKSGVKESEFKINDDESGLAPILAVSPGGKFLALALVDRVELWDLTTGKCAGDAPLPVMRRKDSAQRWHGLCFSLDGNTLAGLLSELDGSRLVVWNMASGAIASDHQFNFLAENEGAPNRALPLQPLTGANAWLLFERVCVPATPGAQTWAQLKDLSSNRSLNAVHFYTSFAPDRWLVYREQKMIAWTTLSPAQAGTLRALTGPTNLRALFTEELPELSDATLAATKPVKPAPTEVAGVRPALPAPAPVDPRVRRPQPLNEQFDKISRAYVAQWYTDLLASDDATLVKDLRWWPAGARPMLGVRWALGVSILNWSGQPPIQDGDDSLERFTAGLGPQLREPLIARMKSGAFGNWPLEGDERLRGVAVGANARAGLIDAARTLGLDALVQIELDMKLAPGTGEKDYVTKVRLIDVDGAQNGRNVWVSPEKWMKVGLIKEKSMPAFVSSILGQADAQFALQPMPEITAEQAAARLAKLGDAKGMGALRALAEVRYYQAKKLATPAEAEPVYDKLLGGAGRGHKFATGTADERKAILAEFKVDGA